MVFYYGNLSWLIQSAFGICWGLVPGPPWIPKSTDAQVPYTRWRSTVSPPYLQVYIHGYRGKTTLWKGREKLIAGTNLVAEEMERSKWMQGIYLGGIIDRI